MTFGLYQHFKGSFYYAFDIAEQTETGEELVIYKDINNKTWARPKGEFFEVLDLEDGRCEGLTTKEPRFELVMEVKKHPISWNTLMEEYSKGKAKA